MKYLVTGGAGFIGANLCRRLLDDGHKVLCLDDLSTGRERNISELMVNENFKYVKHDITKPFFPEQLDGIFNLASPASPVHYQYNQHCVLESFNYGKPYAVWHYHSRNKSLIEYSDVDVAFIPKDITSKGTESALKEAKKKEKKYVIIS